RSTRPTIRSRDARLIDRVFDGTRNRGLAASRFFTAKRACRPGPEPSYYNTSHTAGGARGHSCAPPPVCFPPPGLVLDQRSHAFLRELLETPSPSGFERPIQDAVRRWAAPIVDEVRTDRHGNVIAELFPNPPTPAPFKVLLAGHCDQIGLMVQYVDSDGFL